MMCRNSELRVSEEGGLKSLLIRGTFVKDFTVRPDGSLVQSIRRSCCTATRPTRSRSTRRRRFERPAPSPLSRRGRPHPRRHDVRGPVRRRDGREAGARDERAQGLFRHVRLSAGGLVRRSLLRDASGQLVRQLARSACCRAEIARRAWYSFRPAGLPLTEASVAHRYFSKGRLNDLCAPKTSLPHSSSCSSCSRPPPTLGRNRRRGVT